MTRRRVEEGPHAVVHLHTKNQCVKDVSSRPPIRERQELKKKKRIDVKSRTLICIVPLKELRSSRDGHGDRGMCVGVWRLLLVWGVGLD